MRLHLDTFAGMIPAIHPSKLPVSHAADCSACFFDRGVLLPMREPSSVLVKNGLSDPVLGMHRTAGGTWQTYSVPISVCRSPIIDNEHYLLTGTGLAPRQFDQDEAEAGTYRPLGLPYPPDAPDIEVTGTGNGTVDVSVSYVYTYVTDQGEESASSYPTAVVDVEEGQSVLLTGLSKSTVPSASHVQKYRIYRLQSGSAGAVYDYLGETSTANNSFTDSDPGSDLNGDVLQTEAWIAPPSAMQGIISYGQGTYAGYTDKDVWLSEVFIPYAYPSGYSRSVNAPVVGLAPVSGGFYALTTDKPVLFTGSDPGTILQQELNLEYACVSARSIASNDAGVIYATERGLVFLGSTGADTLLTEKLYTEEQWGDLFTEHANIIGAMYAGDYVFCEQGGTTIYTLDISAGAIVPYTLEKPVTAMWYDGYTSMLYLALQTASTQTTIFSWQTGDASEYTWKSRQIDIPQGVCFSCAKVLGDQSVASPTTIQITVDGVTNWLGTKSLTTEDMFRLPSGRYRQLEITLAGSAALQSVILATSPGELNGN